MSFSSFQYKNRNNLSKVKLNHSFCHITCKLHLQVEVQEKKMIHTNHSKPKHLWDFWTARSATKIGNETAYMHIKKQSQFVVENVSYFVSHPFCSDVCKGRKWYHFEEIR